MISFLLNIILLTMNPSVNDADIQKYLENNLRGYEKITFDRISEWDKYPDVKIVESESPGITGNIVNIPVTFERNNSRLKTHLAVRVEAYKKILVSKHNIKSGRDLEKSLFNKELVNCITLNEPLSSLNDYENHRVSSYLRKGEPLLLNSIEPKPAVKSGDKLIAHSIAGNVDVQIVAIARQEGSIDEIIRVKTQDNKLFKAKILDNSNVLIIE